MPPSEMRAGRRAASFPPAPGRAREATVSGGRRGASSGARDEAASGNLCSSVNPQCAADKGRGLTCGSGGCAGPGVWPRLFGLPPWGMWLGCPAILHASLARHGAAKETEGFLRHTPVHLRSPPRPNGAGLSRTVRVHSSWRDRPRCRAATQLGSSPGEDSTPHVTHFPSVILSG